MTMKTTHERARWALLLLSTLLFASMLACQAGAGEAPTAQLTFPPTGRQVAVGDVVPIHSTSQDDRGATSAPGNPRTFAAVQQWTPTQAGVFNVGVRAYDSDGQISEPALVTIEVVATAAEVTQPLPEAPVSPTQAPQPTTGPSGQPTQGPAEQPTQTPLTAIVAPTPQFAVATPRGPDLVITDFTYSPSPATEGVDVAFSVTMLNQGDSPTGNFHFGIKPITPSMLDYAESEGMLSLSAGESLTLAYNGEGLRYSPGTWTAEAFVDMHGVIVESDETNNTRQVQITVVEAPAPTATSQGWQGATLYADPARSGHLSIGMGGAHVVDSGAVVGDDAGNGQIKGFLTFDLSGIPAGATIDAATLNLGSFHKEGTPLDDLGALTVYLVNYGDLDGNDWDLQASSTPARYQRLSAVSEDQDVLPSVKLAFGNGWDYQLRLEFAHPASNDGQEDSFEFDTGGGGVRLVVTYTGG
jgi:hypothetical protein